MWGSDKNLAAFTDRPAVSRSTQRVRYDVEGERVSFDHDRTMRQRRQGRQSEIPGHRAKAISSPLLGTINGLRPYDIVTPAHAGVQSRSRTAKPLAPVISGCPPFAGMTKSKGGDPARTIATRLGDPGRETWTRISTRSPPGARKLWSRFSRGKSCPRRLRNPVSSIVPAIDATPTHRPSPECGMKCSPQRARRLHEGHVTFVRPW